MQGVIDSSGKIEIPLFLRQTLGLFAGSPVSIEAEGDHLVLKAVPSAELTWDDDGLPLLNAVIPPSFDIHEEIEISRRERDERILGFKLP